ncbi:ribulose-phosphate 3-epimerase [Candidatus Bathyarchaeota archaeon]|nr:ribulose-phosphate 3-epimerase [Candidatus Bathyarchaeota archaeon]
MKYLVVPAIITNSQNELSDMLTKVEGKVDRVQLDVMDGKYVPNFSLNFDFELPPSFEYEAHLMIKNPLEWVEENAGKVEIVIIHVETLKDVTSALKQVKKTGVRVGLALTLETKIEDVKPHLKTVDQLLIMTVDPGSYCVEKEFRPEPLENIKGLREINQKIPIEVDGCMNPQNARLAKKAGANLFASGSYIFKSANIDRAINELREAVFAR